MITTLRVGAVLLAVTAIASAQEGSRATSSTTTTRTTKAQPQQPAQPQPQPRQAQPQPKQAQPQPKQAQPQPKQAHPPSKGMSAQGGMTFMNPRDMKWVPAPPVLPRGAQMTVLYGDPMKPDTFVVRLRAPSGYKIPPHWHTQDEQLTVIAGNLALFVGDTMTGQPHVLEPGGYHFLPGGLRHAAETRGDTIVQISGHGPFDIHYVNPADQPAPRSARR